MGEISGASGRKTGVEGGTGMVREGCAECSAGQAPVAAAVGAVVGDPGPSAYHAGPWRVNYAVDDVGVHDSTDNKRLERNGAG